jgi:hypothetical protein
MNQSLLFKPYVWFFIAYTPICLMLVYPTDGGIVPGWHITFSTPYLILFSCSVIWVIILIGFYFKNRFFPFMKMFVLFHLILTFLPLYILINIYKFYWIPSILEISTIINFCFIFYLVGQVSLIMYFKRVNK